MGPFLVVFMGISLVTVPEAARILRNSLRHFRLYCILVGSGLAIMGLLWGIALLILMPHGLGTLLLGKQLWRPAYGLVLPYTISVMGGCLIGGATAGLHALGAARRSVRAMVLSSAIFLTCGVIGAYLDGAVGTVWGAALATWLGALLWWWQLRLAVSERGELTASDGRKAAGRHRGSRTALPAANGSASDPADAMRGHRSLSSPRPARRQAALPGRTDEEVLDGQSWADEGDVSVQAHVNGLDDGPGRLAAIPVVRGGEGPVYRKVPR